MDLVVAALATWQIVEIWHHSYLMAPLRARTEMWDNTLGDLLSCPFCLSPWVALCCVAGMQLDLGFASLGVQLVLYAFAASRLANLGNDFFSKTNRTPKVTDGYEFDDIEGGDSPE